MAGTKRFFPAASMKEVKQQRNSQSIYFVTGGVFERDKEKDAEEAGKKILAVRAEDSVFSCAFSSLVKCLCSMFHADIVADVCLDIAC